MMNELQFKKLKKGDIIQQYGKINKAVVIDKMTYKTGVEGVFYKTQYFGFQGETQSIDKNLTLWNYKLIKGCV